ncbi:MAG: hypothetical protein HY296_03350 [Thaumarchaeota archaeon]|nr:hypothetical protein [Nitrososphaerota archaeon]
MAWCKVSSLTAAVSTTLRRSRFPLARDEILNLTERVTLEGWELQFFLSRALMRESYPDLRAVMSDLEEWLDQQV